MIKELVEKVKRDAIVLNLIHGYILHRRSRCVANRPSDELLEHLENHDIKLKDKEMQIFAILEDYFAGGQKFVNK